MNMKNYIIGTLAVVILFLGSLFYKEQQAMVCLHFPVPEDLLKEKSATASEVPIYLFLFFSKKDCIPCLLQCVEILNTLPSQFIAAGIVPEEELNDEPGLRSKTGASFPFYSYKKYRKYLPWHTPTLFGVSPSGKIIFVLPGVQGQEAYLENIIEVIYGDLSPRLKMGEIPTEGNNEKRRS